MVYATILIIIAALLSPVVAGGMEELPNATVQILLLLAVAVFIFRLGKGRNAVLTSPPAGLLLLGFLVLSALGAMFTECAYNSLAMWLFWLACIAAYFLCVQLFKERKSAATALVLLSLAATLICLWAVRDLAILSGGGADFWKSLASGEENRLFGTFVNPNFFGGFLVIVIPISIGLFLVSEGLVGYLLFGIAALSQLFALVLTSSKFSVLSMMLGLAIFFVGAVVSRTFGRTQWIKIGVLIVLGGALMMPASAPLLTRVSKSSSEGSQVHSTAFRIYTWKATAKMIAAKPLAGVGMGNFDIAFPRFAIAALTKHAHQSYLQIGAEGGIAVLLLFVGGLGSIAVFGFRLIGKKDLDTDYGLLGGIVNLSNVGIFRWALMGGLAASCARNLVDSDWYIMGISTTFWVCAGILVASFEKDLKEIKIRWDLRWLYVPIGIFAFVLLKFALADYYANHSDASNRYEKADRLAMINPVLARNHALKESGSRAEAQRLLEKAIRLAPKDAAGYFVLSMVQEPQEAVQSLQSALNLNPHSTQAMLRLASLYESLGDKDMQLQTYRQLIGQEESPYEKIKGIPELVDTSYAIAHYSIAEDLMSKKHYRQAAEHLEKAVERVENWRSAGDFLDAARAVGQLTEADEDQKLQLLKDSYAKLAECYIKLGKTKQAREAIAKSSGVHR